MFDIHPLAEQNFNQKAELLLHELSVIPEEPSLVGELPDIHISGNLGPSDIVGEISESFTDYRGNYVGRIFYFENVRYGLVDSAHKKLVKLAEAVIKTPSLSDKLSRKFVEDVLFEWVKNKRIITEFCYSFVEYLQCKSNDAIALISTYVPIANTMVSGPFSFCGATIKPLSKNMFDSLIKGDCEGEIVDLCRLEEKLVDEFRREYQGYAIIEFKLECEPQFAADFSFHSANQICDLLGLFSGAVLMPDIKSMSRPKGSEGFGTFTMLKSVSGKPLGFDKQMLNFASNRPWVISHSLLRDLIGCGLSKISDIATSDKPSQFEETILNMALIYSKAAFTAEPLEKLVYMLSALESTLLGNENEPIQQNIGERMAIFTYSDLQERKALIKNLRFVYGLRSRYLHHGRSTDEMEQLSIFFRHVWLFFVSLIGNFQKFKNKAEFIAAIDDHKLG